MATKVERTTGKRFMATMKRKSEINWLRLETRIKDAIRKAESVDDCVGLACIIVTIDEILASELGRGNALSSLRSAALTHGQAQEIQNREWNEKEY